jgi:CRISPR-associated protein Cmr4
MKTRAFFIHTLSPLHAGVGQSADVVDLPIARMQATGMPIVPGSSIKGVLRDARSTSLTPDEVFAVFGPETDADGHAGAIGISDARLLAMPVRSFRGTFAWATSPLLLNLASRDLIAAGLEVPKVGKVPREKDALCGELSSCCIKHSYNGQNHLVLEDLDFLMTDERWTLKWSDFIGSRVFTPDFREIFQQRFVVLHDEIMTFLWETATQIDTRVRIDSATGIVKKGALWVEESLPSESLLIGVLIADRSRRKSTQMNPDDVLDHVLANETVIQVGGKATVGRGRCRLIPCGQ